MRLCDMLSRESKVSRMQAMDRDFEVQRVEFDQVPQIDVAALYRADRVGKERVAKEIRWACRNVGFFYVRNHGVPSSTIDALFAAARDFFALPDAQKQAISSEKSLQHRGYVGYATEQHDPQAGKDLHEALDFGRELPPDTALSASARSLYGPNQYPAGLPAMEPAARAYYAAMLDLGNTLLRGFALSLDLAEDFFLAKFDHAAGWLRLLHYPPQRRIESDRSIGVGAHTDYECFTMLAQDGNGGLQVQRLDGRWIAAPPIPGTFVINIADLMARWTNDLFRSTMHRAVNQSGNDRYSIPFFLGPNADTMVNCLPTCVEPGASPKYPAIRASEWILARVLESQPYLSAKS